MWILLSQEPGMTPLYFAVSKGMLDIVLRLLQVPALVLDSHVNQLGTAMHGEYNDIDLTIQLLAVQVMLSVFHSCSLLVLTLTNQGQTVRHQDSWYNFSLPVLTTQDQR